MTKASRCLMDLICKTSPPSLDKTQCNGHSATISFPSLHLWSPPPPFPLLRSATPCTAPPRVTSVTGRVRFLLLFFANEVFCAWSADHLFTEGKTKTTKKTYCKPIAMHLTETGVSSSCPTFRVIPNHHGGATGSHAVTIKPSSLLSRSLSQLTIRWLLSAF